MTESAKWIPVSEAQRLTGLATRTIKRIIAESRLRSARTRGGHIRVLRADVDGLLHPDNPASDSATDVLKNKHAFSTRFGKGCKVVSCVDRHAYSTKKKPSKTTDKNGTT